jgi:hypothetical protein
MDEDNFALKYREYIQNFSATTRAEKRALRIAEIKYQILVLEKELEKLQSPKSNDKKFL